MESGQYERSAGGQLPKWFREQPAQHRGDDFYMRAFSELATERQFGQVIGPIPWSKIVEYGSRKGLDDVMIDVLVVAVREMDEAWLAHQREQQQKAKPKKKR